MSDLMVTNFDYGDLNREIVDDLERRAVAIAEEQAGVRKRAAEGVIRVGRELAAAHDLLAGKGRDGLFRPWVLERCEFTYRTAYNCIQATETFGGKKCETVLHFFDATALYLLSGDSCPVEATEEAVRIAKKGQRITRKLAQELRDKYTEPLAVPDESPAEPDVHGDDAPAEQPERVETAGPEPREEQDDLETEPEERSPQRHNVPQDATQPATSVLTTLRAAVQSLANRTRDKVALVRSLRTIAIPEFLSALAQSLESYPSATVGNYLSAMAEEIEETDAG